ncbi:MAG TPA: MFS transporter [Magnetospirillaceae bacterium]|jgi:SHS family lactate transporter-like MFS transporter
MAIEALSGWTRQQKFVVTAAFLGWTLDAFDFFLMVFVLKDIATEFGTDVKAVSYALLLTLAARPVGAFLFGRLADRVGRRPALMIDVLVYSALGFASGFSSSLTMLLVLRTLFGVAMGGEWGVGSSLAMETIPAKARGFVSGLLQAGYPFGYLLASLAFWFLFPIIGWRGMLMLGALPALLIFFVRMGVPESPVWTERKHEKPVGTFSVIARHWKIALYAIVLMTAFNFFSHGSQDLYPTFLRVQHKFDAHTVGTITVILNIGAIFGGIIFGSLSQRIGRRRAIVIAALIALPVLPLWGLPSDPVWLAVGAFLMQISVQGAWGVIPVHLNELSPPEARGTFPGTVYQLGNLIAAYNATLQSGIAESNDNNYGYPMMLVIGIVAVAIALLAGFGVEARGVNLAKSEPATPLG